MTGSPSPRAFGWPIDVDGAWGGQTYQAVWDFQRGFAFSNLHLESRLAQFEPLRRLSDARRLRGTPLPKRDPSGSARPLRFVGLAIYFLGATLQAEEQIDWPQIAALYGELSRLTASPVVELNRAVAVAEAQSPQAALEIVEGLPLNDYRYLHSTRAELLRRLGRADEARAAYRRGRPR